MKKFILLVLLIALVLCIPIQAAPGDNDDPIVVLSYLNQKISTLINQYNLDKVPTLNTKVSTLEKTTEEQKSSIDSLNQKIQGGTTTNTSSLEVVNLAEGEKLIASAGTEIILRGGTVTAITSKLGGLSDITASKDIQQGEKVQSNHMLIVPRDDGRGVYSVTSSVLMVRGKYQITK